MSPEPHNPLDDEIEAALAETNLQEVDLPARRGKKSGGGPSGENAAQQSEERLMTGTIVDIRKDDVFVELGPRMQGFVPGAEFEELPKVGDTMQFTLRGREEDGLYRLSHKDAQVLAAWNELQVGSLVKARVSGQNTGGLELTIGNNKAFMPASQAGLHHVADLSELIGQTLVCSVLEINRAQKRVVLSRRAVLEEEQRQARERASDELSVGQVVRGKVTRLETFGAFVDIGGGLEGLVHVSNLSRKRVEKAEDHVAVGQEVEALVLDIKEGGKRIGLGMKQLEPDPWQQLPPQISEESIVTGKIIRLAEFGAFVEIADGLEGLLHVSQMGLGGGRRRPEEAVKAGEEVTVRIQAIEIDRQRISLSMLDRRGARIGSEEAVDEEVLRDVMDDGGGKKLGTNLGDLFKKAMDS